MKLDAMAGVAVGLLVFLAAAAASVAPAYAFNVQVTNSSQDCDVAGVIIVKNQQAVTTDTVTLMRGETKTIQVNDQEKWLCPDAIRVFFKPEQGKCHFIPGTACLDGGAEPCQPSCAGGAFYISDKKQNNLSVPDVKKR